MRIEYYNNILCIEASWMIEVGIITKNNYDRLAKSKYSGKDKLNVLRKGGNGRTALVEWSSIPQRFMDEIIEKHGNPAHISQESHFEKYIKADEAALNFFSKYELPSGDLLKPNVAMQYYNNAIILNAIRSALSRRTASGIFAEISKTVNKLSLIVDPLTEKPKYPHNLPTVERRLRNKYNLYLKEGYSSLIHGNFANNHARKVSGNLEWLILSIYCKGNKPYASWVHEDYLKFIAGVLDVVDMETGEIFNREDFRDEKRGGYIQISESTCWNYINNPKNRAIVDSFRSSRHTFSQTIRPHHHREAPSYGLSKISLDDRNIPRKLHNGKYVFAYYAYDVASGCLIGASYSLSKNTDLFIDCIRDMFQFIDNNSWGMPMEMEVEHHLVSQFKDDLMKAGFIFPFVRWCAPTNSQEKHAERLIGKKKYGYEKRYQDGGIGRFYASNEANRTDDERYYDEEEREYKTKERTYSYEEIVADDRYTIEKYNNSFHSDQKKYKNKTKMQVLIENLNPNLVEIDRPLLVRWIGEKTETTIRRNQYFSVQYNKYTLPSPQVLKKLAPNNYTVDAYYLPGEEIKEVYIYQNDSFIATCAKINKYNTAACERTDKDREAMVEQSKYIAEFDKMIKEESKNIAKVKLYENLSSDTEEVKPIVLPVSPDSEEEEIFEYEYSAEYFTKLAVDSL